MRYYEKNNKMRSRRQPAAEQLSTPVQLILDFLFLYIFSRSSSGDATLSIFDLRQRKVEGRVTNQEDELLSLQIMKVGCRTFFLFFNKRSVNVLPWGKMKPKYTTKTQENHTHFRSFPHIMHVSNTCHDMAHRVFLPYFKGCPRNQLCIAEAAPDMPCSGTSRSERIPSTFLRAVDALFVIVLV